MDTYCAWVVCHVRSHFPSLVESLTSIAFSLYSMNLVWIFNKINVIFNWNVKKMRREGNFIHKLSFFLLCRSIANRNRWLEFWHFAFTHCTKFGAQMWGSPSLSMPLTGRERDNGVCARCETETIDVAKLQVSNKTKTSDSSWPNDDVTFLHHTHRTQCRIAESVVSQSLKLVFAADFSLGFRW